MRKIKIINVVGARPNFMKIAPIVDAINKHNGQLENNSPGYIESVLVHTGQHYDEKMSKLFFEDLEIPKPDIDLEVGSGTHAEQTAEIMKRFEPILQQERPDYILVLGDVNSTIACALTASKLGIKIIHVEAGLRSFDRTMPEEINRVLTDAISDILFTSERSAEDNLVSEGVSKEKIFFVGNVMIDSLLKQKQKASESAVLFQLGLDGSGDKMQNTGPADYAVVTLHRPGNVDSKKQLQEIMDAISVIAREVPVVFPIPYSAVRFKGRKSAVVYWCECRFLAAHPESLAKCKQAVASAKISNALDTSIQLHKHYVFKSALFHIHFTVFCPTVGTTEGRHNNVKPRIYI